MFIINLTYHGDMQKVDELLAEHIEFLNEQYESGNFLASGRKVPRTGGIILCRMDSKEDLEKIIAKDPFHAHGVANFEVIEFVPSKTCKELAFLVGG